MKNPEVEPTAMKIDDIAITLRKYSTDCERIAKKMRETKDLSYAGEILNLVFNLLMNLRLDLMVTRPIRSLEKALIERDLQ